MPFMTDLMGDPAARQSAISDVIESRSRSKADEDRLVAAVREEFQQQRKSGPKGPTGPRTKAILPTPMPKPWIKPTPDYRGMPIIAIERSGELRIRTTVRREITKGTALYVRVAAEDGYLWIEPCPPGDPNARRVGTHGEVKGGSMRHEFAAAGFQFGRSYLVERDPDGCWVALADQPESGAPQ